MNKHTRELIIALIIFFLLTIFLFANIEYRNKTILEQEDKIINLQIELDNAKEIIDKQQQKIKDYEYRLNKIDIDDRLEAAE